MQIWAPEALQEDYDNAGLLVRGDDSVSGVLITLDCTEEVVDEAIAKNCNFIVAHHPIVFRGLKKFTGKNYVERTVMKAIRHNISIYAAHTNLDSVQSGVNQKIAEKLGISSPRILQPKSNQLRQLAFFVPEDRAEVVKAAIFEAGAGEIGNYKNCSFQVSGTGNFMPLDGSEPYSGENGKLQWEQEFRVEVIFPVQLEHAVVRAMKEAHPYEEVAYQIYPVTNTHAYIGSGMIGELETPVSKMDFLQHVKQHFGCEMLKYTPSDSAQVQRIAWCGGSGFFLLGAAKAQKADVFITSDVKYHEFFDAEREICLCDIGHYESEQFTSVLIMSYLIKKFPNFALRISGISTNPVKYL